MTGEVGSPLYLRHYNELVRTSHMKNVAGVLLVLGCLASICGCRTSKESFLARGDKFFAAGKYADAALNYGNAIKRDPNYGEAYYHLAQAEIKEQKPREAFDASYRAFQLLPNNIAAKEQLGSLSLEFYLVSQSRPQRFYNLVQQVSDELLHRNPKSFEGLREKAYLAATDGKRDQSIALFRKALEVRPSDPVITTALIEDLFLTGHGAEAERIGLDLIARQKSYGPVYEAMYQWYLKEKRLADAENILKTRVSNNPREAAGALELAAFYSREQKTLEMQAALQRLLDDPKDFPQAPLWVGEHYLRFRNYPQAVRYFEEGIRNSQGATKALYQKRASEALFAEGQVAQASSTIEPVIKENPRDEQARRMQASLLLRSGNPEKIDAAEREFQEISKLKPDDASIWWELGQAEELKGNPDVARSRYQEALKKNRNYLQARYGLAELDLAQRHADEALEQSNEILKVRPNDPRATLLHAQALARSGNAAAARVELTRIRDLQHNPQAQVELGLLALSQKNYKEAEQIFGELRSTGDPQAMAGLARAYASQKQFDKALEVLNEGLKKSSNSPLLVGQLGITEALAGKFDAAVASFQKLVSLEPKSVQDRIELASVLSLQGDDKSALEQYREAAKLEPTDLNAGLQFARALNMGSHIDEARTQYQAVLKTHPNDATALNAMAFFIWQSGGNLDQAQDFAERALKAAPGQPSFTDTMGCIYLKKGLKDSALQVFGNLVKKYPNYPTFRYHLGMALLQNGDKKSAKKELETALAAHPSRQDEARIRELLGKIS